MEKLWVFILGMMLPGLALCQFRHLDFLGAGHDNGVIVTASSSSPTASAAKTVDGFPIQNQQQLKDASRFLAQATFGADFATIEMTAAMGYEAWLEEQFNLPQISILEEMLNHNNLYEDNDVERGSLEFPIYHTFFRTAWMTNNLTSPDLLRQRMAFNLSQIMVINDKSDFFEDVGQTLGNYYDMLAKNAFGNYQNLLLDVTLSPAMGNFLSHYNNPKAIPLQNIHPDENYAREIMQLFSIGLWELNPDGTRKRDAQGQFIPTYSNADIKEFAQVFTGLGNGRSNGVFGSPIDELEENAALIMITPMKMYDAYHDNSEKQLLNGAVLPANQSGMADIQQTIQHLANHNNTASFICKALIKMLTTSNPTPAYVRDVASVFNPSEPNNFQEVIKAILLHPQARSCTIPEAYTFGKLREPIVRLMNFLRAFQMNSNEAGDFRYGLECFNANTGQSPLESPSVFNFFLPDYRPPGPISQNYLIAPEFQILNATNALGLVNDVNNRAIKRIYLDAICIEDMEENPPEESSYEEEEGEYAMDYSATLALIDNPTAFIDRLDILLANGLLSTDTKGVIRDAMTQLETPQEKLRMALYLILISPDYAILK